MKLNQIIYKYIAVRINEKIIEWSDVPANAVEKVKEAYRKLYCEEE